MLRGGSPFIRSQPPDIDQELTSVEGEVLTQECDTRLMEHGQLCQPSGEACKTQAPGFLSQETSREPAKRLLASWSSPTTSHKKNMVISL